MIREFLQRLRFPLRPANPYVVVPLGKGLFGTAPGTFNEMPGIAVIPAPNFQPGEIGTEMEVQRDAEGKMRVIPGGTIIITFEHRHSLDKFIDTCIAAREFFPGTGR